MAMLGEGVPAVVSVSTADIRRSPSPESHASEAFLSFPMLRPSASPSEAWSERRLLLPLMIKSDRVGR
jgi:hypothetical protein